MTQNQIVTALLAAARSAVATTLGERAEVVWPLIESEARAAAEEAARELIQVVAEPAKDGTNAAKIRAEDRTAGRPAAKIPAEGWTPGRCQTWSTRHTVTVTGVTGQKKEIVSFVYDVKGATYSFAGIERSRVTHGSDGSPFHGTEKLGSTAVSREVWIRVYKEDKARRSYY